MYSFSTTVHAAHSPKTVSYLCSEIQAADIGSVKVTVYNDSYRPQSGVVTGLWIEDYRGQGFVCIYLNKKGRVIYASSTSSINISEKEAAALVDKIYKQSMN